MVEHAIILAAGYGSRLRERSPSKPLAKVCGVSLIEIAIRQAVLAGISEVRVVTGHKASPVEDAVDTLATSKSANIQCIRLGDHSKPNGWSVIAGAKGLDEPFLLMMADHVFGDDILGELAQQSLTNADVVLAVDRIDNPLVDPDDATWVETQHDDRIRTIGKDIPAYDVVDCGAFLANDKLPEAIAQAIEMGKAGSLSDGMQVLADRGRARVWDIGGKWWIDVDDPRAQDLAQIQASDHLRILAGGHAIDACV